MDDLMKAVNGEFFEGNTDAVNDEPKDEVVNNPKETDEEIVDGDEEVVEPPKEEYKPNTKYKIKDQELEFDKRFEPLLKSKEDEEYIRELYTKAGGLDSYKEKLEKESSKTKEYEAKLAEVTKAIEDSQSFYTKLVEDRNQKKFRSVAKSLGISEDDLLTAALEIAAERELPEQDRVIKQKNREMEEALNLTRQQTTQQQQYIEQVTRFQQEQEALRVHQELVNKQTAELNNRITSQYADLDKALKDAGLNLFDEAVIAGKHLYDAAGGNKEITTDEALKAAVDKYSKLIKKNEPKKQIDRKDTLPIIEGSNSSKIGDEAISSFDDIKKELEKLQNNKQ